MALCKQSSHVSPQPIHTRFLYSLQTRNIANVGRSTAAETTFRVNTVYGLLCDGKSRGEIVQFAAENWQLKDRMADELIARARVALEKDAELSRPAFLAEVLGRLRNYEQQAARRGQLMVAVNCVRLQCELVGLTEK